MYVLLFCVALLAKVIETSEASYRAKRGIDGVSEEVLREDALAQRVGRAVDAAEGL